MNYVLAVFRNRSETLAFSSYLNKYRINNQVVSTPSSLGEVCGISVKFHKNSLKQALNVFRQNNYLSFNSFYLTEYGMDGRLYFKKIMIDFY